MAYEGITLKNVEFVGFETAVVIEDGVTLRGEDMRFRENDTAIEAGESTNIHIDGLDIE